MWNTPQEAANMSAALKWFNAFPKFGAIKSGVVCKQADFTVIWNWQSWVCTENNPYALVLSLLFPAVGSNIQSCSVSTVSTACLNVHMSWCSSVSVLFACLLFPRECFTEEMFKKKQTQTNKKNQKGKQNAHQHTHLTVFWFCFFYLIFFLNFFIFKQMQYGKLRLKTNKKTQRTES